MTFIYYQSLPLRMMLYLYILYLLYNIFFLNVKTINVKKPSSATPTIKPSTSMEQKLHLPSSFLDDFKNGKSNFIPREIPKIIHQTWKVKDNLPKKFDQWSKNCRELHSEEEGLYLFI